MNKFLTLIKDCKAPTCFLYQNCLSLILANHLLFVVWFYTEILLTIFPVCTYQQGSITFSLYVNSVVLCVFLKKAEKCSFGSHEFSFECRLTLSLLFVTLKLKILIRYCRSTYDHRRCLIQITFKPFLFPCLDT